MSPRRTLVAALTLAGLMVAGTGAAAIPPAPAEATGQPGPVTGLTGGAGRVVFHPVSHRNFPNPDLRVVKGPLTSSNDVLARLGDGAFTAYGTGTVMHADPELASEDVAITIDLATADIAYSSQRITGFGDELGRSVTPDLPDGHGRAQARAVMLEPPDAAGDVDTGRQAEAQAPPTGRPDINETSADLTPVLDADSLRAEAHARAVPTGCVIGSDLARADATANDTDIADTDPEPESTKPLLSLGADEPVRAISHSASRLRLTPIEGQPGRFGVLAEVRQTIAPITFGLPGIDEKFTIEVGGEWVLRATADGTDGRVSLGPETTGGGDSPVLRLIHDGKVVDQVGIREIGGRSGIFLDGDPVGDIRIGGDARAISGRPGSKPTELPTRASAAADVVVVRLFEPRAELRIGHMEVAVAIPDGGVPCPGIEITKTSEPASVRPGQAFSWNFEVSNPNDCQLEEIKVTDRPEATAGVKWTALTSLPRVTRAFDGSLVFADVGPIATGEVKRLTINARVEPESAPGTITNRAVATGTCGRSLLEGKAEAITSVDPVALPALPARRADSSGADRPTGRPPTSDTLQPASEQAGGGGRSSAPALSSLGTRRTAAAAKPRGKAQLDRGRSTRATAAVPLPRSGADTAPHVGLAVGLLGAGLLLRRWRPNQR